MYDADELGEWVPRIRQAAGQVKNLPPLMNNCYANYGTTNARESGAMLESQRLSKAKETDVRRGRDRPDHPAQRDRLRRVPPTEDGWWFHLRRCVQCGHIGCCDQSPSQHTSKHAAAEQHPIIHSFEPGEDWFYDYELDEYLEGPELAPPNHHPLDETLPGPDGRVPRDWSASCTDGQAATPARRRRRQPRAVFTTVAKTA